MQTNINYNTYIDVSANKSKWGAMKRGKGRGKREKVLSVISSFCPELR
jgi:hypothetical protein